MNSSELLVLLCYLLSVMAAYFLSTKLRDNIRPERKWLRFFSGLTVIALVLPLSFGTMLYTLKKTALLDFGR